jgi:hypothetical protein
VSRPFFDGTASVAEGGRLLVAQVARDRHALERPARLDLAVDLARGPDLGQHRGRHAHDARDLVVPRQGLEVHEHGATGVRHVGDVQPAVRAAREVPDQPGVHVAEHQVAGLGLVGRAVHVVQRPADLGAGEIRGQRQPDLLLEARLASVLGELVHELVRARVLPDERVVHRLARVPVPHQRGLALVGNTHTGDVVGAGAGLAHRFLYDLLGARPDLVRIVLDPPRLGIDLLVLLLSHADHLTSVVEDHAA